MDISQCMKRQVISIHHTATVGKAAALLVKHHIGLLPVIESSSKLIGVLGLSDLLSLSLPAFVRLIEDLDFVHDFGAVENARPSPEALAQPVTALMRKAISVTADSGLLRAYSLMYQHKLHDLPVVNADGTLVGIASRVDIGTVILAGWQSDE